MTARVPSQAALPQPSDAATALALTASPDTFPTDSHALAIWIDTARKQALEEAAKVADDFAQRNARAGFDFDADENRIIATAIRAIGSQNDG